MAGFYCNKDLAQVSLRVVCLSSLNITCVNCMSHCFIFVRSLKSKEVTTIGPLKLETQNKEQTDDSNNSKLEELKQELLYNFSHWGR